MRRRVSNCFVAVVQGSAAIAGYYTLAASSLQLAEIAANDAKKLPRYPIVPAALVGRLAVDRRFAGAGLGSTLLADAMMRAARADPAVYALVVDAKDDTALAFYRHLGFTPFETRAMSLYLSIAGARKVIRP